MLRTNSHIHAALRDSILAVAVELATIREGNSVGGVMTARKIINAGVLLAIGILVGLMLADISSIEHVASEWQTLIAGILAVIAAVWTVTEMRRSDGAQQIRHDQQMSLNLRADRLRARRAAFPFALHFSTVASVLAEYDVDQFDGMNRNELTTAVAVMRQCWLQMHKFLNEKSIVEAKDLFDSNMAHNYRLVIDDLERMEGNHPAIEHFCRFGEIAEPDKFRIANFYRGMALYAPKLKAFSDRLLKLADQYGTDCHAPRQAR